MLGGKILCALLLSSPSSAAAVSPTSDLLLSSPASPPSFRFGSQDEEDAGASDNVMMSFPKENVSISRETSDAEQFAIGVSELPESKSSSHSSLRSSADKIGGEKRNVGWKDPLCSVEYIPKEGRGVSVIEYRKQLATLRQRQKRSQEFAEMRSFFSTPEHKMDPVQSTIPLSTAELELLDSIYPSSTPLSQQSKSRTSYDMNTPMFTFKKITYEPTLPVLPSTTHPTPSDELILAKLPVTAARLHDARNQSDGKKKFERRRSSSDAGISPCSSRTNLSSKHPELPTLDEKEDQPFSVDYKLVSHADHSGPKVLNPQLRKSAPTLQRRSVEAVEDHNNRQQRQRSVVEQLSADSSLPMRRNMFARMPPFLRNHCQYGMLLSCNRR
eukprot:TRINITY_DN2713_c0_g1_i3.p1 TRINITY_DN2713_c0_g1~~TRINITY_DN2713_c0_g1_i3.p1  ORF type:complete len:385 (+),score=80.20 TRINITY_DN2713_c0_g1_i3:84-1238(+)